MNGTGNSSDRPEGNRGLLIVLGVAVGVGAIVIAAVLLRGRQGPVTPTGPSGPPTPEAQLARGQHLYGTHCAACHGELGDGNGPAARFLYPRPRSFHEGKFRLVGNRSSIPSDAELMHVLTRGMPGSAMVPFGHLAEDDRRALVAQVRLLIRTGAEERLRKESDDGKIDAELLAELIRPGEPLAVPSAWPAESPDSVARGHALYGTLCASCHGTTGKGDGTQDQRDDNGMPTRPRDFTRGIFKGGREREQLYARIRRGMPGTPMPSSDLTDPQVGDLIHYILSLSDPAAQGKVEHRRTQVVANRSTTPLEGEIAEDTWTSAPAVPIVVSPLWWRDYAEPDLRVQALHDGKTIALRLSWQDATVNDSIGRPEDFEDLAAVQLYRGEAEPFLGMGSEAARIDLWQWRASWQRPATAAAGSLDDYPFVSPNYAALLRGKEKEVPDFLTARAAGNLNSGPERDRSAGSLAARGFGSTTFLPRASQRVSASASWKDGRWTVVLKRPLGVGADEGYTLEPGGHCSAAFALWDGAAGDRNGQKLVSIWHDLKIE